jgi:hypothetical protein
MKPSPEKIAVLRVIRRWMPEIRRAASAAGQGPGALLERVLESGLPRAEGIDVPRMLAKAEASGFEEVGDLDRWQARRERDLTRRLSGSAS